jgi:hypothetical protein
MPNNINPEDVIWDEEGITWDTPSTKPKKATAPTPTLMERARERLPEAISGTARLGMAGLAEPIKQVSLGAAKSPLARPGLEIGGALAGSVLASPGMVPTVGLAPALGAGLGYAAGGRLADYLDVQAGRKEPAPSVPLDTLKERVPEAIKGTARLGMAGLAAPVTEAALAPQTVPQTLKDVSIGAAMEMGGPILGKAMGGIGKLVKGTEKLENMIDEAIAKGLRPTVKGKGSYPLRKEARENAIKAVKTIVTNKDKLNLVDKTGQVVNKLPESLDEFAQSIDILKKDIFKQYDDMAKAAEQAAEIPGAAPGEKVFQTNRIVKLDYQ